MASLDDDGSFLPLQDCIVLITSIHHYLKGTWKLKAKRQSLIRLSGPVGEEHGYLTPNYGYIIDHKTNCN
jgi:hypothetical protein